MQVDSGTTANLTVSRDSMVIACCVDRDGNGTCDWVYYPDGRVAGVPVAPLGEALGSELHAVVAPNPARGTVRFVLEASRPVADVRIEVYDVTGWRVRSLPVGAMVVGARTFAWDGRGENGALLRSGVYFYCTSSDHGSAGSRRVLLLR